MADEPGQTFQQLMDRMEVVVESLETGNLTLEESLELFEEGVRLSRQATSRLEAAEKRIEELLADGSVVPFAEQPARAAGATPTEGAGA
jgi:exodeoxyribonuclease VII small subunit